MNFHTLHGSSSALFWSNVVMHARLKLTGPLGFGEGPLPKGHTMLKILQAEDWSQLQIVESWNAAKLSWTVFSPLNCYPFADLSDLTSFRPKVKNVLKEHATLPLAWHETHSRDVPILLQPIYPVSPPMDLKSALNGFFCTWKAWNGCHVWGNLNPSWQP